jgi:hypothetical protein
MRNRQRQWFVAFVLWTVVLVGGVSSRSYGDAGSAFTIGSGLSLSILMPDVGDNLTVISAPEGNQLVGASPGLRLGHVSATRGFEFGFGTGVLYLNSGGESAHVLVFGVDLQKHFVSQSSWNLFLGGDLGMSTQDFFAEVTQPYFGAMIGGRNIISDDNGSMKVALHVRHHLEDEDAGADSFNELALALHFDLWIPD